MIGIAGLPWEQSFNLRVRHRKKNERSSEGRQDKRCQTEEKPLLRRVQDREHQVVRERVLRMRAECLVVLAFLSRCPLSTGKNS